MASAIYAFHLRALEHGLSLLARDEVRVLSEARWLEALWLLEAPLRKLLEIAGPYGGRFISEGVRALEVTLGATPSRRRGLWPESLLERHFGPRPAGTRWSALPVYSCQIDCINDLRAVMAELLLGRAPPGETVDHLLFGCVVLTSERGRLERARVRATNPWRTYRNATPPIRVWDREACDWVNLEAEPHAR